MYEFMEAFMFGAMLVEWFHIDDKTTTFYLKPDYEIIEQTIKEQHLEGLSVAEILQNHIDLFEVMLKHFNAIPDDMITDMNQAQVTLEVFAEYLANRIFDGDFESISEFDFKENYLKSI